VFAETKGVEADLMRRVILGYVSYGLNRVGEVAESAADVDTIMSFGFNWTPPSVIVDLIGAKKLSRCSAATISRYLRWWRKLPAMVVNCIEAGCSITGAPWLVRFKFGRELLRLIELRVRPEGGAKRHAAGVPEAERSVAEGNLR